MVTFNNRRARIEHVTIEGELTHDEIMKLLALSRSGLLELDGVKQKVWLENGKCWLTPAPCYFRSNAVFVSLAKMRDLLK